MFRKKENAKIQVLFKVYGQFSSAFQNKFGFQGLFKTALHFQVPFKLVRTLLLNYLEGRKNLFVISKAAVTIVFPNE